MLDAGSQAEATRFQGVTVPCLSTRPLTFVIPAKEEGRFIGRTLRLLLATRDQDGLDFDVVVVDGGSSDDTVEQAALADCIIVDSELGRKSIGYACNVGAGQTSAEFLFHTDADVLFPELASFLGKVTSAFNDSAVVAVTTRLMPYPWEARRRDRAMHRLANALIRGSLRCGAFLAKGECQIVRRSAFEAVGGYNGDIVAGEDCDLFYRLNRIGRIVYIADHCVYHSPRRFRQVGYTTIIGIYAREAISLIVRGRSFLAEWPVVR